MSQGKVWLVGAGPGDVGLLTIKANEVIQQADVVVYDKLVGEEILLLIPETAKAINVGKTAGNHTIPQEEINLLLLEEALKGKKVVRLKGGDPFLFGRGGEELELLRACQIPYEIVPGVTSAIAVPAYYGIPVTHRNYCSSLHIITGHKRKGKPYDIDFDALVRTKGTLVFLMGITALSYICRGLLDAGMEGDMPTAILQQGTTAKQKKLLATLGSIEEKVTKEGVVTPAIIVVGKVCKLTEEFSWHEQLPLSGIKVLVARPREGQSRLSYLLRSKGAQVLEVPTIQIRPIEPCHQLKHIFSKLKEIQWLVFTSAQGVDIFFSAMRKEKIDIRSMGHIKIAAIGEGTKCKVEEYGILVDLIPPIYDGKSLGETVREKALCGETILVPRAGAGNEEVIHELKKGNGLHIIDIAIYDTVYAAPNMIGLEEQIENRDIDYVVFTSKSTVNGFVKALPDIDYSFVKAICIGVQTEAEAKRYNMTTWTAKKATIDSMIETMEALVRTE